MSIIDNALQQSMKEQVKSKVVWENMSPASTIGSQTIPIDLSGWDDVEIVIGNNNNKMACVRMKPGDTANLYTNGVYIYSRRYTISETGVTIANGNTGVASDAEVNNNAAKPFTIYARKIIGGGQSNS